jgi:hypothetical protein
MAATQQLRYGPRHNAKTWANQFRARLLRPGPVSYEDTKAGVNLLEKPALDRCIQTFVGKPLVLSPRSTFTHPEKVTKENQEQYAVGYISAVEYDPADGWWYAVGTVHDDEGKAAAREIGLVSCAYDVTETGPGGTWNNISYELEILSFEGEHLAIVKNPRYEAATIRLNAKTQPRKHMFKISLKGLKNALSSKKQEPALEKKNDVDLSELPDDATIEVDGKQVTMTELVASHQRLNAKDGEEIDPESELDIGGERITINELIARANGKKNAETEEKKDEDGEKKENAESDDEKSEKDSKKENDEEDGDEEKKPAFMKKDSKKNARTFRVNTRPGPLSEARENGLEVVTTGNAPDTMLSKLARGNERYGSKTIK